MESVTVASCPWFDNKEKKIFFQAKQPSGHKMENNTN
jgi:hypothetical protein